MLLRLRGTQQMWRSWNQEAQREPASIIMLNISGRFQSVRTGSFIPSAQVLVVRKVLCAFCRATDWPRLEGIIQSNLLWERNRGDCSNLVQLYLESLQWWRLHLGRLFQWVIVLTVKCLCVTLCFVSALWVWFFYSLLTGYDFSWFFSWEKTSRVGFLVYGCRGPLDGAGMSGAGQARPLIMGHLVLCTTNNCASCSLYLIDF